METRASEAFRMGDTVSTGIGSDRVKPIADWDSGIVTRSLPRVREADVSVKPGAQAPGSR